MTNKVIKGTTAQCLKHFAETNRFNVTNLERCRVRNQVCQLIGVSDSTGHSWFVEFTLPKGENMLRLRLLLEVCGYEINERQLANPTFRALADQVALRALSVKDAAEFVGTNADHIVGIMIGREGASPERIEKITELVELHKEEAEAKLKPWRETLQMLHLVSVQESPARATPRTETVVSSKVGNTDHEQAIQMLAHLILGVKPLAQRVLSDEFTSEERQRLRDLTANGRSNGVFDLSNLLNRLCGERARKEL